MNTLLLNFLNTKNRNFFNYSNESSTKDEYVSLQSNHTYILNQIKTNIHKRLIKKKPINISYLNELIALFNRFVELHNQLHVKMTNNTIVPVAQLNPINYVLKDGTQRDVHFLSEEIKNLKIF